MSYYNDLASKTEQALQSVASGLSLSGVSILTGLDDATKALPNVICAVTGSTGEQPPLSGNYTLTCRISVNTKAESSGLAAHRARVAQVFDEFRDSALAATLSAAVDDFHCMGVIGAGMGSERNESQFVDFLDLEVYCCGTDL